MNSFISRAKYDILIKKSHQLMEKSKSPLINSQDSNIKEKPVRYFLSDISFNPITRVMCLNIIQMQDYRTIVRYVTHNYVKHPIFSDWKTKKKLIKKTIKLTNAELEKLNFNSDKLIRLFANAIVIHLGDKELYPSWFLKSQLYHEKENKIKKLQQNLINVEQEINYKIKIEEERINSNTNKIIELKKNLNLIQQKLIKQKQNLDKVINCKNKKIKTIFSFGVYGVLHSGKRLEKLQLIVKRLDKDIMLLINEINKSEENHLKYKNRIKLDKEQLKEKQLEFEKQKNKTIKYYDKKISQVRPLTTSINRIGDFIPLKSINGLKFDKIKGCYIIHNIENDKYYVGQSKDILRRLKEHFRGTVPRNSIFSEDYYTSSLKNKEDIFEIKIIKCETKDELDEMEKSLINKYDSYNNGYNGTIGNL